MRSLRARGAQPAPTDAPNQRRRGELSALLGGYSPTPTGVAIFPREIRRIPRSWGAASYNVQQWRELPKGGHFAALEQPELLAAEVLAFADLVQARRWV